jgi:hypothetical protein
VRRLAALACLGLATVVLGGCGGGADEGEEARIETAIVASNSNDPADCSRYSTLKMLEQSTKLEGDAAIGGCEQVATESWPLASELTVTDVEVDGAEATAHVAFEGAAYDGQTFAVALVERDGRWKVDGITAFVVFDRERMIRQWGRLLLSRAVTPGEVDVFRCMASRLDILDDEGLEALVLDPSPEPLLQLSQSCEPGRQSA